ncbi:Ferritin-like protein 2 [Methanosarcina sp. MTP4]|uniref:ferritin n=1 Tax=Methanosarcina sp. MTP4 TaxID=1434100 RepID=UPI000616181E|nr:ferritin [Methanosarcina sp. MTP4]AKB26581.1 Ferritin-like protein 2 [Methanosarcina sp. MTP4]
MLNEKMQKALNEQINKEMYSAYLYLAMSAYCSYKGLAGFANWFKVQYGEEMEHADKIYKYLVEQGARVELEAIEKPPTEFGTLLEMFEKTLAHEQFVTHLIRELLELAVAEKDYATSIFLQWFVEEQVEEEANDSAIIAKLKLAGEDGAALLVIDSDLGKRGH